MIGRTRTRKDIMRYLRRKQNVMVIGSGGIGKSTLLKSIVTELGPEAYYIETMSPAKTVLRDALAEIGDFSEEDLTPILFLPLAFLGAMRYLGFRMGNPELYILAGSLTAAAIVIRVLMPRGNKRKKAS